MSALEGMFFGVGAIAVIGALGTVLARNVVYAALSLLVSLMAIAGIFVLISSPFLALVQVLIYGGAIIVVVLFALMLTHQQSDVAENLDNSQKPLAALVAAAAVLSLALVIVRSVWPATSINAGAGAATQMADMGKLLFTQWSVPFEVASLLLLVALIGAIVIARPETE